MYKNTAVICQITTFSKKVTIFSYFIYNNEIKYYNVINVIGINI